MKQLKLECILSVTNHNTIQSLKICRNNDDQTSSDQIECYNNEILQLLAQRHENLSQLALHTEITQKNGEIIQLQNELNKQKMNYENEKHLSKMLTDQLEKSKFEQQKCIETGVQKKMEQFTKQYNLEKKIELIHVQQETEILKNKLQQQMQMNQQLQTNQANIENKLQIIEQNTNRELMTIADLGNVGEDYVMNILQYFYKYDNSIKYYPCSKLPNSADIGLSIYCEKTDPNHQTIEFKGCIEVKNYKNNATIPQKEIDKLIKDIDQNQYDFGILATIFNNKFADKIKIFDIIKTPNQNKPIIFVNNLKHIPDFLPAVIKIITIELKKNMTLNDSLQAAKLQNYQNLLTSIVNNSHKQLKQINTMKKNMDILCKSISKQVQSIQDGLAT